MFIYADQISINFRLLISELRIKLERSQAAIRILNQSIGTTILESSTDPSDDNISTKSNEVEQEDCHFGNGLKFTTNVIQIIKIHFIRTHIHFSIFFRSMVTDTISMEK